ncbi:unnamed protein product [Plutella xylostella]|uniref:(diamondback moth) hypothetical protein n=1 Tax=Plutella xylostella TaxID=51655 RepID=A0A8S4GEM4_PLUXY|nr:unnamed protein product [Plutella xylostella]
MKVFVCLLLTVVSVWGFPELRSEGSQPLQLSARTLQTLEPLKQKPVQRDCNKGKCASSIAQKAAAEAKAAQAAQNAAGAQAAHMVKTQLAEKALQAAKAAEAALAGKQAVVEQLQQEVKEAEAVVNENSQSSHSQEATISAAVVAAQQATALRKITCQATQFAIRLEKQTHCLLGKIRQGQKETGTHKMLERDWRSCSTSCGGAMRRLHGDQARRRMQHAEAARAACSNARRKKSLKRRSADLRKRKCRRKGWALISERNVRKKRFSSKKKNKHQKIVNGNFWQWQEK